MKTALILSITQTVKRIPREKKAIRDYYIGGD